MSPRVVGPSGIPVDVSEAMARGLVRDGYAELAEGEQETVLDLPDPTVVILNPEVSPGIVTPVGNTVSDVLTKQVDPDAAVDGQPRGNASRDEWVTYALANGKTEDDLHGLKQGEIRALFAAPEALSTDEGTKPPEVPATGEGSTPDEK